MNQKLQEMIGKGMIPYKHGAFIDSYNQAVNEDIAGAITSNVDRNKWIIEVYNGQETDDPAPKSEGQIKDSCMIDTYNQQIQYDVSCTIRTNINTANHHFIMEEVEPKAVSYTRDSKGKVIDRHLNDYANTIHQSSGSGNNTDTFLAIPEPTAQGYAEAYDGDSVNLSQPNSKTRRGRVGKQISNTLDTGCQQGVVEKEENIRFRIRKLTPRECFRLMGVDDADIDTIQASGISNSQQYKCAGNSIVVDVLYHLFRKMFVETENENQQLTLF